MKITFFGAAKEVTGSAHMISNGSDQVLLDCGLFQGRRKESAQKNQHLPFEPEQITNLVLSHAHIDHSGRIPLLSRRNFNGRVICTRATSDACNYMLKDSAHIQESDANYLNYKTIKNYLANREDMPKGRNKRRFSQALKELKKRRGALNLSLIHELLSEHGLEIVAPLYTMAEAEQALDSFDAYPYGFEVPIGKDMSCRQYDAGHILGSAISFIKLNSEGQKITICYTGDIGRFDTPILRNPTLDFDEADRQVDLLIIESTYGDRMHDPVKNLKNDLKKVLVDTLEREGTVLIPAFAFGRTQELIYTLHELYLNNEVPQVPVFIDSPLSNNLTRVYGEHPEAYDRSANETFLQKGHNPFMFEQINFITAVEDSMALMRRQEPHIVVASSGMCEAGRILHHLRYKIHDSRNTIIIVGFMAQNTLGRRILEGGLQYAESGRKGPPPVMKFLNKTYPLKAEVVQLGGFSAHADKDELFQFVTKSNLKIDRVAVVHGETDQSQAFADVLKDRGHKVVVPDFGQSLNIDP